VGPVTVTIHVLVTIAVPQLVGRQDVAVLVERLPLLLGPRLHLLLVFLLELLALLVGFHALQARLVLVALLLGHELFAVEALAFLGHLALSAGAGLFTRTLLDGLFGLLLRANLARFAGVLQLFLGTLPQLLLRLERLLRLRTSRRSQRQGADDCKHDFRLCLHLVLLKLLAPRRRRPPTTAALPWLFLKLPWVFLKDIYTRHGLSNPEAGLR
jgi:hypothetical protein